MIRISLILFIFCLSSCVVKKNDQVFEAQAYMDLITATKVETLLPKFLNNQLEVSRPAGTWIPLFRIIRLGNEARSYQYRCIFYRVPSSKLSGVLKVVPVSKHEICKDYDKKGYQLEGIKKLKTFLIDDKMKISEERMLNKGFLSFNFRYEGEEKWLEFPLLNKRQKEKFKRYSNSAINRFYKGIIYWPIENHKDGHNIGKAVNYLGSLGDSYLDRTAVVCHQVDKSCRDVKPFDCDRCQYGWHEVVDYRCPQGGSKYCSPNRCGQKGQPACPRGFEYLNLAVDIVQEGVCFQDSPYGLCEKGLNTYCDENKVLVCL